MNELIHDYYSLLEGSEEYDTFACLLSDICPSTMTNSISADPAELGRWVRIWNMSQKGVNESELKRLVFQFVDEYLAEVKSNSKNFQAYIGLLSDNHVEELAGRFDNVELVNDYSLMGQENRLYNADVKVIDKDYKMPREHDHCSFCFDKVTCDNMVGWIVSNDDYNFICQNCFQDMKVLFNFKC